MQRYAHTKQGHQGHHGHQGHRGGSHGHFVRHQGGQREHRGPQEHREQQGHPHSNTPLSLASAFLTAHGWGAQGKSLGISKMFQESDVALLKSMKAVAALRPRGVLSGFLVITPAHVANAAAAVFVPPATGRQQPFALRMRLSLPAHLREGGAIFSAYSDNSDIVLEDVLAWGGKGVFATREFAERWGTCMAEFVAAWQPDDILQGCSIRLAEYMSLTELQEPEERQVLEIVPLAANAKRLVWAPAVNDVGSAGAAGGQWIAKRESLVGPDVFSLWSEKGERQPAYALVRTLAVSKALRLHPVDEFRVKATWNKMFERWEIVGVGIIQN